MDYIDNEFYILELSCYYHGVQKTFLQVFILFKINIAVMNFHMFDDYSLISSNDVSTPMAYPFFGEK
ncbi:hypothetical protein BCR32DRAFT_51852 [Anaeromyces robustus]|uniref:Uncharacterized protein n=1 Tax=Anaeromyces robustus TaxID=1754192 RepID=A0A1Y1WYA1_9FUNG|nr:hypothetical protein BCR32DRAFT_51852 [Anaeromyces robustus]|eukprot:ORX78084.1 hypothetical protein BCR32DRAFT_51852 [Anaeromyces robustus]